MKSGYMIASHLKMATTVSKHGDSGPSTTQNACTFWNEFWNLKLLRKVSFFLWSLFKNKLPTSFDLHRRIPTHSPDCNFYGDNEPSKHLFFECPLAIWINSPIRLRSSMLSHPNALDCWKDIVTAFKGHGDEQYFILLTAIIL